MKCQYLQSSIAMTAILIGQIRKSQALLFLIQFSFLSFQNSCLFGSLS